MTGDRQRVVAAENAGDEAFGHDHHMRPPAGRLPAGFTLEEAIDLVHFIRLCLEWAGVATASGASATVQSGPRKPRFCFEAVFIFGLMVEEQGLELEGVMQSEDCGCCLELFAFLPILLFSPGSGGYSRPIRGLRRFGNGPW